MISSIVPRSSFSVLRTRYPASVEAERTLGLVESSSAGTRRLPLWSAGYNTALLDWHVHYHRVEQRKPLRGRKGNAAAHGRGQGKNFLQVQNLPRVTGHQHRRALASRIARAHHHHSPHIPSLHPTSTHTC